MKPTVALVAHGIHDRGGMERALYELVRRTHDRYRFVVLASELDERLHPSVEWQRIRVPMRPIPLLREHTWLALVYAASASIAGLLFLSFDQFGPGVLLGAVPIVGMFLSTLHFYFAHIESSTRRLSEPSTNEGS